jgi:hypothetical protein
VSVIIYNRENKIRISVITLKNKFQITINKIKSKPYEMWVVIGEKMNWFERKKKLQECYEVLEKSFMKVKKKFPKHFEGLDIER